MADNRISASVRELVAAHIHSIEQLEVLLLLQAEADRAWTPADICDRLKVAPGLAQGALEHLAQHALIAKAPDAPDSFRYGPRTPELARQGLELARAYGTARVELLVLISTHAIDRVRTAGLRTFARAFLLKGPKKGPKDDG